MKILVALDDSPHSERALEFVTRMRWPGGSTVVVVCVAQPVAAGVASPYETGPLSAGIEAQHLRLRDVATRAEQILREHGFSATGCVYDGDPRESLIEASEREHADLLVVGSHGRTGLAKLMLGSVSSHVVTHAPCSVLVIKGPRTTPASRGHGAPS